MEDIKKKPVEDEHSSEATVERGKKAVEANEKLNQQGKTDDEVKKEREKDSEQWRNEG